uniref:Chaperone protein DnaK n=1 Tax=Lygus hesperus TaxID=30085 RepID=A0A0A9W5L8_LYGHE
MKKKNKVKVVDKIAVEDVTTTNSTAMSTSRVGRKTVNNTSSRMENFVGISMNDCTLVCCYAANLEKPVQIIYNKDGGYTTPVVAVSTRDALYVGSPALNVAQYMPTRVLLYPLHILARAGLGKVHDDAALPVWWEFGCPLTVSRDTGTVVYDVERGGVQVDPKTLVSEYLCRAKEQFSTVLETQELVCVLTYPDTFTSTQCEALLQAAEEASLKVCALLPESLAIALAFRIDRTLYSGTYHAVVNIGYMCTTVQCITNDCGYLSFGITDGESCTHDSAFTIHIGIHDFIAEIVAALDLPTHIDPYVRHTIADMILQQYIECGCCSHISIDSLVDDDLEHLHTCLNSHADDIDNALEDVTDILV